jgi:serine O-acetyltransferase
MSKPLYDKRRFIEIALLGDNVYIGAGAKILGGIEIGNNLIIDANAVLVKDAPDNVIIEGILAKMLKHSNS